MCGKSKKLKEYILEDRQQVQSPHEVSTCHATLQCPVSATLLLMQFPANASLEAADDSSSAWAPANLVGNANGVPVSGLGPAQSWLMGVCGVWISRWRFFSPPFYVSNKQILGQGEPLCWKMDFSIWIVISWAFLNFSKKKINSLIPSSAFVMWIHKTSQNHECVRDYLVLIQTTKRCVLGFSEAFRTTCHSSSSNPRQVLHQGRIPSAYSQPCSITAHRLHCTCGYLKDVLLRSVVICHSVASTMA